jgi:hypothetical protein
LEKVVIIYKREVERYINDLVFILFKEEYFGFSESAVIYKDKIIEFLEDNIATFPSRKTPIELSSFGSNYISINPIKERLGIFSLKEQKIIISLQTS